MTTAAHTPGIADLHGRVSALFSPIRGGTSPALPPPAGAPGPGRIGVEVELIPVRRGRQLPEPVGLPEVSACLAADPGLLDEAGISFEPGGQLELSPAPAGTAGECLTRLDGLLERVRHCGRALGIEFCSAALNPWHDAERVGLQNDAPRYRVMQEHFDRIGPDGRRMMRQTAALQICLDIRGRSRWELLNQAGPALAAAFAASPVEAGRELGIPGGRLDIWQGVDPDRTGFDGRHLDTEPARGYTRLALEATALPLARESGPPPAERLRLGEWLARRGPRPDRADLDHHISTLFPPVRPRGYLELRCLDALPRRHLDVALATVAALCCDPAAEAEALGCVRVGARPGAGAWARAARLGVADPALRATADDLLGLAAAAATGPAAAGLPAGAAGRIIRFREELTAAGRAPADGLLAAWRSDPEDPTPWT